MKRHQAIRFKVEPRMLPAGKVARRLFLTPEEFAASVPDLWKLGFPRPCPVTKHYDSEAVEAWLDRRSGLARGNTNASADEAIRERLQSL